MQSHTTPLLSIRLFVSLAAVLLAYAPSVYAGGVLRTVYEQDFSSDPGYSVMGGTARETYAWDSSGEYFKVIQYDDRHGVQAWAYSSTFETVQDSSFHVEVDMRTLSIGWGAHQQFYLGLDGTPNSSGIYSSANWNGTYSARGAGQFGTSLSAWHRFVMDYDVTTGMLDVQVSRLSDGHEWSWQDITYTPSAFNRVFLGCHLIHRERPNDATQVHYDNILVAVADPIPEPATMLAGLAGLAGVGRYLRRR